MWITARIFCTAVTAADLVEGDLAAFDVYDRFNGNNLPLIVDERMTAISRVYRDGNKVVIRKAGYSRAVAADRGAYRALKDRQGQLIHEEDVRTAAFAATGSRDI